MQQSWFFEELHLSVPVDIYSVGPGVSVLTTVCIQKASEYRGTVYATNTY
jgi:hypothetical protein